MSDPIETSELLAFTKTVDGKSLSRAAAELGVPRATVSRRVARLEERLGARLLRRTTRSLSLTDAGEALYRHARLVIDAVEQAEKSVRRTDDAVRGDLRVSVPSLDDPAFHAMLSQFAKRHPHVRLQVFFSSRHVDLRRDGYDVAIRGTAEIEPGLVARTLGRTPVVGVASPDYLAEHGTPHTVRDLKNHRCLVGFTRGELPQSQWPLGKSTVHVESSFSTNDIFLLARAAADGLGIALIPERAAQDYLDRGELVHVLAGVLRAESRLAVVYAEREFVPAPVRAFVDAAVAWAEGQNHTTRRSVSPSERFGRSTKKAKRRARGA